MTYRTPLLATAIAFALTGCSPESADDVAEAPVGKATRAAPQVRQALTPEDIESAALTGELACAFSEPGTPAALLVAMADVTDDDRAEGVLRLGASTLRLRAEELGGFNAMVRGARFTSGDLEARVIVTSDTPTAGGESPPLPARLEIVANAGSQRIDGEWACGP